MREFLAVAVENHANGKAGPLLGLAERTEIVRQLFREHGHNAVRKIHRIATEAGFAIERTARPYIEGNIGNRDNDDATAGICGIGIRRGPYRIVMILCIFRIDGDKRDAGQILAVSHGPFRERFQLVEYARRELVAQAMIMNRDETYGFFGLRVPYSLGNLRSRPACRVANNLEPDQLAVCSARQIAIGNRPLSHSLFIDGLDDEMTSDPP